MTLALALVLGLAIGLSLGALGGGGSILTVPALVYAVGERAQAATTGSLVIVGVSSGIAALGHARAGRVRWGAGVAFGVFGIAASFLGTRLNARVDPQLLLACFAVLMLIAAGAMLAKTTVHSHPAAAPAAGSIATSTRIDAATALRVVGAGLVVGFLTGFLGVGGGFVIVPALVLTLRYEMPEAVGTSLLIISLNSAVALLARGGTHFHWAVIVPFTVAAVVGSAAGRRVSGRVSAASLTRAFALLLLAVAAYVLIRALT